MHELMTLNQKVRCQAFKFFLSFFFYSAAFPLTALSSCLWKAIEKEGAG